MLDQPPAIIQYVAQEKVDLTLYYYPECPYSQRVLTALKRMGKTVPMKNIRTNNAAKLELIEIGGKAQVPCLVIDGEAMYESSVIIKWLQDNQDLY